MRFGRGNKFGNQPTNAQLPGIGRKSFHSKLEADRAMELAMQQEAGQIKDLQFQVPFSLVVPGFRKIKYVADFVYTLHPEGRVVVEDTKGVVTPVFTLKAMLLKVLHDVDVLVTKRDKAKKWH